MSFTYDTDNASADLTRVRRFIADTEIDAGPLPGGANFSDEEINQMIADEGSWQRAVAAAYEALAAAWAGEFSFAADGLTANRSQVADRYAALAAEWRRRYGGHVTFTTKGWIRVDGYSDDVTSDDVVSSSEWAGNSEYIFTILRR